jgi:hypothetical protein
VGRYRIIPFGFDRWAVQRKDWFWWNTLWSSFRLETDAERDIERRLQDEAEERARAAESERRKRHYAPREYP